MLVPKDQRIKIYQYLFKEGVLVAKKVFSGTHPKIEDVKNLYVIKLMQGFESKGFVKERFAWRHYYWYLTDDGVNYLREYLHLPDGIVPTTHKKTARTAEGGRRDGEEGGERRGGGGGGGRGYGGGGRGPSPQQSPPQQTAV